MIHFDQRSPGSLNFIGLSDNDFIYFLSFINDPGRLNGRKCRKMMPLKNAK